MGTPVSKKDTSDSVKVAIISGIFGAVITPLVVQVLIPAILKWSTPAVPGISFLWAVIGGVAGVLLGYFLIHPWFFSPCPLFAPTSVTITSPAEDSTASRLIIVQGTACHIPQDKELWLLVVPADVSAYYPQHGPVVVLRNGKWSANAYIGREGRADVGKGYLVCTALVDQEGRTAIQKYFESAPNFKPLQPPLKRIELISQVRVVRG